MGYLKSGSLKSLAAGGISASLLLFVYSQLPVRPALASAVGLGKRAIIKFIEIRHLGLLVIPQKQYDTMICIFTIYILLLYILF